MGDPEASYSMARALEKMLSKEYRASASRLLTQPSGINSTVVRSKAATARPETGPFHRV
jgi:hypothetical protein